MQLFKWGLAWLKSRKYALAYFVLFCLLLFLVYGLYGYPVGVAGYTFLLGITVGAVFAGLDIAHFVSRHIQLEKLPDRFPLGELPPPRDLLQEDYTEIILALEAERCRLVAENDAQRQDAQQYYTLWAHQIKTPIAAMRIAMQQDAANKRILEQELFRIEQYVGMVLQYQRLHSLNTDLVLERYEVKNMVKQAAKNLAPLFIHKNLPLTLGEIEETVVTDSKWFIFVLEQLLTNAIKYTKTGGLTIYTESSRLIVKDTGIGILPEDLPRVFERGYTGATGRMEPISTGLGLYLCRQIIERLGLGISIKSAPGQGTSVIIDLAQQEIQPE